MNHFHLCIAHNCMKSFFPQIQIADWFASSLLLSIVQFKLIYARLRITKTSQWSLYLLHTLMSYLYSATMLLVRTKGSFMDINFALSWPPKYLPPWTFFMYYTWTKMANFGPPIHLFLSTWLLNDPYVRMDKILIFWQTERRKKF